MGNEAFFEIAKYVWSAYSYWKWAYSHLQKHRKNKRKASKHRTASFHSTEYSLSNCQYVCKTPVIFLYVSGFCYLILTLVYDNVQNFMNCKRWFTVYLQKQNQKLKKKTKPKHKTKCFFGQEVRRIAKKCTWRLRPGRVARIMVFPIRMLQSFAVPWEQSVPTSYSGFTCLYFPQAACASHDIYIHCSWFRNFKKPPKSHFPQKPLHAF